MHYDAHIENSALVLTHNGRPLLKDATLKVNVTLSGSIKFIPDMIEHGDGAISVSFKRATPRSLEYEIESLSLILRELDGVLRMDINAKINVNNRGYQYLFIPENTFLLTFSLSEAPDACLSTGNANPYWMDPIFSSGLETLDERTENLCLKYGEEHFHFLPLVNDSGISKLSPEGLNTSVGAPCLTSFSAPVMTVSASSNPYDAVKNSFSVGKRLGTVGVKLREERSFPDILDGFGWCSWDACYSNVSSSFLYRKLDELKAKNIKLRWLLIDDGWSQYTDRERPDGKQLLSFRENPERFPEGLKECIKKIKNEYGVKYVGVWHAFTGYWHGVADGSEIASELPDALTRYPDGRLFPASDFDGALKFWDSWHSYLEAQGVDFVKVDNQGAFAYKFLYSTSPGKGLRIQHSALEISVFRHFGGAIINCMGCTMQNGLCRPESAVNRNSDDFYPRLERGFTSHIRQNIYSAVFNGQLHYCDFDMWWSKHTSALQSSILRAISGGPVYVSDELGNTDATYIHPLCSDDGSIYRPEGTALPTYDCFYRDFLTENIPFKIFNRQDDKFIVAAYGLAPEKTVRGAVRLSDIPGASGRYAAQDYFTKRFVIFDENNELPLSLYDGDVALFNLYPIDNDGFFTPGDPDKYVGIATPAAKRMNINDIIKV